MDPNSKFYIFVGYGDGVKGYRLWDPTSHKIIINRDVVFDEMSLMKSDVEGCELKQVEEPQIQWIQWENQSSTRQKDLHKDVHEEAPAVEYEVADNSQEMVEEPQQALWRSTRVREFPKRYEYYVAPLALINTNGEPSCY